MMTTLAPPISNPTTSKTGWLWCVSLGLPVVLLPLWSSHLHRLPDSLGTTTGLVLLLLISSCTYTDLTRRKIFNWATYSAVTWSMLLHVWASYFETVNVSSISLRDSLLGFAGCFVIMLFPYILARGGAGDVKLAAAIGSLVGFEQGIFIIAVSYILAGAAILAWSIWMQGPLVLLRAMGRLFGSMCLPLWIQWPTKSDQNLLNKPIPLAGFFAAGTLIVTLGLI